MNFGSISVGSGPDPFHMLLRLLSDPELAAKALGEMQAQHRYLEEREAKLWAREKRLLEREKVLKQMLADLGVNE